MNRQEKILQTIAWWLPRRLVYWCAVRVMANASRAQGGTVVVPDIKAMDALKAWDEPPPATEPP